MALRQIRTVGDPCLTKVCKEVEEVNERTLTLIDDMLDTMYVNNGVGLAAPQVGENLRIFVIDVSTNEEPLNPMVFINPKIIKKSGLMKGDEGCLSFPQAYTEVWRYNKVTVKAMDKNGRPFLMEAEGNLLAKAIQHEFDHLDGILFIDHATNRFVADEELAKHNLPPIDVDKMIECPEEETSQKEGEV